MIRVPGFKNLLKRQFSSRPIRAYAQELVDGPVPLGGVPVRNRQQMGDRLAVAGYRESFAPFHLSEYLGKPNLGFRGLNGAQRSISYRSNRPVHFIQSSAIRIPTGRGRPGLDIARTRGDSSLVSASRFPGT